VTDPSAPIRPTFNGSLRIEGRPERLTSESGALILRETVDRMGIVDWLVENLVDPRHPNLVTHPMTELLRTRLFLMAMGWRDGDDADALRDDAALRLSVSDRRGDLPLQRRTPAGGWSTAVAQSRGPGRVGLAADSYHRALAPIAGAG
jgi:Transposase DDE domain group 1